MLEIANSVVLLAVAGLNVYAIRLARMTEKNTNSMREQMVASALKEGKDIGRAEKPH